MKTCHDHTGQDVPALARLLDDLAWDMPPGSQQRLKDHLSTEFRRAEPHDSRVPGRWRGTHPRGWLRPRVWLAVGAGTAFAGVAAAAIAISTASQDSLPPPSPAAIQLLAKVASAAARQPAPHPGDRQYTYVETKDLNWSLPSTLEPYIVKGSLPASLRTRLEKLRPQKSTVQIWTPVSNVCRTGIERFTLPSGRADNEKFSVAPGPGTKCPSIGGLNDASYRLLQTLPTDPHTLLAMIYQVESGHGPSADQEAFVTIGDLLRDKIVPPKVTAALYHAAALIPGVTLVPDATDAIGRHGVAIAQTAEGTRVELIFGKTSLRLIGERTSIASIGLPTSATAIITRDFADHLGQVPPAQHTHHP